MNNKAYKGGKALFIDYEIILFGIYNLSNWYKLNTFSEFKANILIHDMQVFYLTHKDVTLFKGKRVNYLYLLRHALYVVQGKHGQKQPAK